MHEYDDGSKLGNTIKKLKVPEKHKSREIVEGLCGSCGYDRFRITSDTMAGVHIAVCQNPECGNSFEA